MNLSGKQCALVLGSSDIVLQILDIAFSFVYYVSQRTKHDPIDDKQENQKSDNLNDEGFIDADQCNVADDFHSLLVDLLNG
jgi:hypothetical protein